MLPHSQIKSCYNYERQENRACLLLQSQKETVMMGLKSFQSLMMQCSQNVNTGERMTREMKWQKQTGG